MAYIVFVMLHIDFDDYYALKGEIEDNAINQQLY
jgi:hypothetical protein